MFFKMGQRVGRAGECASSQKICRIRGYLSVADAGLLCAGLPDMQEFPASSRQKAAEELKKAQEKAADEVYEAMVKRVKPTKTPDKKFDPWGGLRAPSANQ